MYTGFSFSSHFSIRATSVNVIMNSHSFVSLIMTPTPNSFVFGSLRFAFLAIKFWEYLIMKTPNSIAVLLNSA